MVPTLSLAAVALFMAAAMTDLSRRRIPNALVLALAALALVRLALALAHGAGAGAVGADLGMAAAIFVLGATAFQFRLVGGGDVKLLAAAALWLGAASVVPFLMATALAGGALALLFMVWGMVGRGRPSLPYGVAIAAGGILATAGAI